MSNIKVKVESVETRIYNDKSIAVIAFKPTDPADGLEKILFFVDKYDAELYPRDKEITLTLTKDEGYLIQGVSPEPAVPEPLTYKAVEPVVPEPSPTPEDAPEQPEDYGLPPDTELTEDSNIDKLEESVEEVTEADKYERPE